MVCRKEGMSCDGRDDDDEVWMCRMSIMELGNEG